MRLARILLAVVVLGGILGLGYAWSHRTKVYPDAARREAELEQPEIQECRARLTRIYDAWKAYRADHKGGDPPNVEALFPKYLHDPNLLLCPTAARLAKKNIVLDQGIITVDKHNYPVTYGFLWLTSGYPRRVKKIGDTIPLIRCGTHAEAIYAVAYGHKPRPGAFGEETMPKWIDDVRQSRIQVIRRNGQLDALDPTTE